MTLEEAAAAAGLDPGQFETLMRQNDMTDPGGMLAALRSDIGMQNQADRAFGTNITQTGAGQQAPVQQVHSASSARDAWDMPTQLQDTLDALKGGYNKGVTEGQAQLSQMLMDQAQGKGDSIAQRQLQAGSEENMRNAAALMASQRGVQSQGQMRNIMEQRSQIGNRLNQDAGLLRLQEQAAARQQLGGLYGQMGSQNTANLGLQAGIGAGVGGANIDRAKFLEGVRQFNENQKFQQSQADYNHANDWWKTILGAGGQAVTTLATGGFGGKKALD